jgi:hypothetical protein
MKKIIIVLFSIFCIISVEAQESAAMSNIKKSMSNMMLFNRVLPQEKVYLHFDNTGYFKGETIWFKAYVVRTDSLGLSGRSRVLYVELVTSGGDVIETDKFLIHGGQADGYIKLDDKVLESGFYERRAYTRYMTNWGEDVIFSRVFPIFDVPRKMGDDSRQVIDMHNYRRRQPNTREKVDSTWDSSRKINATFYPEGGNLVVGLPGNVAYDITDSHGAHADARVCVVDGKDTLAGSSTEYMGRGVISFIPKSTKSKLIVTDVLNHQREYEMPEVIKTGYVMNVNTVDSGYVAVHIKSTPDLYDSTVGLLLTHCGMVEALDTVTVVKNGVKIKINSTDMDDGVNQLTLIGGDGHLVADRMIFNYPQ